MHKDGHVATPTDTQSKSPDQVQGEKQAWKTPTVRKLSVDQTEAVGPPGDDGIVSAS